jgi:urease accessory protein
LFTTPSATKLYRSKSAVVRIEQQLSVRAGAVLEWLPQETIAFDGSRSLLSTRVDLEPGAGFIGWELACLGRPAAAERFETGHLRQKLQLFRGTRALLAEQLLLSGSGAELSQPWGLAGYSTVATLVAVDRAEPRRESSERRALIQRLRDQLALEAGLAAVSEVSDVIVCRFLGTGAAAVQAALWRAWELIRPALFDYRAVRPRIWAT